MGARRSLLIWAAMVFTFSACNIASALLHHRFLANAFRWDLGWRTLALLPVAMFLDHGALGGLAVLAAFTLKLLAVSVVMTFFWARSGQATILAIAMHSLSNDVARVGGLTHPLTWQTEVITELNLAAPFLLAAVVVVWIAQRRGWGDRRAISAG